MATNPYWPLLRAEWAAIGHIGYGSSWSSYEDMPWIDATTRRLIKAWGTKRGRQYETNAVQTGTWNGTWDNRDGAFDPSSTTSPYYPNVLPYRTLRLRAQYPPGGANLLTIDQATSGEAGLYGPGASPSMYGVDLGYGAGVVVLSEWNTVASATAYQGTQVMQATLSASPIGTPNFYTRVPVTPGVAYSFTTHIRCMTAGQSPQQYAYIGWASPTDTIMSTSVGSTATLTGGASPSWTTLTASGIAPAGAAFAVIGIPSAATISVSTQFQVDGMQFEAAASPSAWAVPNRWYPLFTGGVERYPQSWTHNGTFGQTAATAVDTFALLSQSILPDPLTAAIFTPVGGAGPSFAYKLGDPSGSSTFADTTGSRPPATINNAKAGAGTITAGVAQTATTQPGGLFAGAPGATVTNISSPLPAGAFGYGQKMSWISLPPNSSNLYGPAGATGRNYTRMIAFRCTTTPQVSGNSQLWIAQSLDFTNRVQLYINNSLSCVMGVFGQTGSFLGTLGTIDLGNWHLAFMSIASDGVSARGALDATVQNFTMGASYTPGNPGFTSDILGAEFSGNGDPYAPDNNYIGDVAFAVEWPYQLTAAQMTAIYTAWKTAWVGDSSGQRYAHILGLAGWAGPTAIDSGSSMSLGAATNLAGQDALSALQAVVDTEAGVHFVDAAGRLTFKGRAARYNATTPVYTFGEGPPFGNSGELPYTALDFDTDPTMVCNLAQVTQQSTGQVFTAQDATSQTNYGVRTRTITNLSTSAAECQDQANYIVSRYKNPAQRVRSLTLDPAGNPALWPSLLPLDISTRVRAFRRPPGVTPISVDAFIESVSWNGSDQAKAVVNLQCSPADLTPYGVFAALHSTLNLQLSAGGTLLTLNALPDSATNSASAQLYNGQSLTLAPGTTNAQTVTVTTVSNTAPGYTTVAVGITPAASATFPVGTTVCEALPASSTTTYSNGGMSYTPPGPTNPAKWDSSAFGNVNFAY